jgi:hypothetical protein
MANVNTQPTTKFVSSAGWYGGRKCRVYRQRLNCLHGKEKQDFGFKIPAYSRVIAAHVRNAQVATVTGTAASATADSIAVVMYPVSSPAVTQALSSAPTTATVKGVSAAVSTLNGGFTNGCIIAQTPGIGTSETNGVYRGAPIISRVATVANAGAENMNPVEAYLCAVPALLSSNTICVNATASTSGFFFGTTTTTSTVVSAALDAVIYVETYDDYPSL